MVSRSWRRLWRCYPNLVFTRRTMLHGNITDDHPAHYILATFISRVNNILWQLRSSSLENFIVKFPLLGRDAHHIDRWVSFSAASRARQIVLYLCPEEEDTDMNDMYSFPLHIFSGDNCVSSLSLGFVSLTLPPHLSGFTNLKKLGLHMVSIRGDLQCLLSQCDVMEWLSLTKCSLQHRSICQKLHQLRYLCVRKCRLQKLDLQAPNLTELELANYPIPIVLGECLNLSVATIELVSFSDCLSYVATELPAGGLYHVQDRLSINMTVRTEVSAAKSSETELVFTLMFMIYAASHIYLTFLTMTVSTFSREDLQKALAGSTIWSIWSWTSMSREVRTMAAEFFAWLRYWRWHHVWKSWNSM